MTETDFIRQPQTRELVERTAGILRQYFPRRRNKDELSTRLFTFILPGEKFGTPRPVTIDKIFTKLADIWNLSNEDEKGWKKVYNKDGQLIGLVQEVIPFSDRRVKIPSGFIKIDYLCRPRDEQSFWPMVEAIVSEKNLPGDKEQLLQSIHKLVFDGVDFYAFLPLVFFEK